MRGVRSTALASSSARAGSSGSERATAPGSHARPDAAAAAAGEGDALSLALIVASESACTTVLDAATGEHPRSGLNMQWTKPKSRERVHSLAIVDLHSALLVPSPPAPSASAAQAPAAPPAAVPGPTARMAARLVKTASNSSTEGSTKNAGLSRVGSADSEMRRRGGSTATKSGRSSAVPRPTASDSDTISMMSDDGGDADGGDDDDDDDDDGLAAAAAEVRGPACATEEAGKKSKRKGLFGRRKESDASEAPRKGSSLSCRSAESRSPGPTGSTSDVPSGLLGSSGRDGGPSSSAPDSACLGRVPSASTSACPTNSAPMPPEAAHVVLVTADALRVYPAAAVVIGDRTTTAKVKVEGGIAAAAPVQVPLGLLAGSREKDCPLASEGGPCVLVLTSASELQIFSLPSLHLLAAKRISCLLGAPWASLSAAASAAPGRLPQDVGFAAGPRGGGATLLGPSRELVRVGLVAGAVPPPPPESLYDWELAVAAAMAAASCAPTAQPRCDPTNRRASMGSARNSGNSGARGSVVGSIFSKMTKAAKTVEAGVAHAVKEVAQEAAGRRDRDRDPEHPGSPHVIPELDNIPEASSAEKRSTGGLWGGKKQSSSNAACDKPNRGADRRAELLGAAAGPGPRRKFGESSGPARAAEPQRKPVTRTASAIRRAYGYPLSKAEEARYEVERAKQMLHERGEKINRIQDKSAAMEAEADQFSDLAGQLKDKYKNRKWWQL